MILPTYCLKDQGDRRMEYAEEQSGKLWAQTHGPESLVFESHGINARLYAWISVVFQIKKK